MPRARKYPVELLDRATRVVFESGRPIAHVAADLGLPRVALKTLEVVAYREEDCPMCRAGSPVVKPGSRPVHASN